MSSHPVWEQYAACWSMPEKNRAAALAASVAEDVVYREPTNGRRGCRRPPWIHGRVSSGIPRRAFVIDSVAQHHDRSLAYWRQLDGTGRTHQHGASFALHAGDGRLLEITGFFGHTPDPEEPRP
jgi:hypothetical protein